MGKVFFMSTFFWYQFEAISVPRKTKIGSVYERIAKIKKFYEVKNLDSFILFQYSMAPIFSLKIRDFAERRSWTASASAFRFSRKTGKPPLRITPVSPRSRPAGTRREIRRGIHVHRRRHGRGGIVRAVRIVSEVFR